MYIDANTIIQAGEMVGAIALLGGGILTAYRWYLKQNKQDEEIEKIIKSGRELPKIAMDLIERANRNGGKDNIAVVLAQPLTGEVEQC